jgi:molybdopterin-guanine dinucleotide biosynthesis protein A
VNERPPPFSAVVLAGGRSTRMGRDKALLPLADGRTLLARQLDVLRAAGAAEVLVSARPEQHLPLEGARLILDHEPDCGPLGGIAAALAAATHDRLLVLAIDLLRMSAEFLAGLVAAAPPGRGLVPLLGGEPEPLAALYPCGVAVFTAGLLTAGESRPRHWARELERLGQVGWREVRPAEAGCFENWNAPGDNAPHRPGRPP